MNYQETVTYLFNSTPVFEHIGAAAYKEGLHNTQALDQYFGHPHTQFRTIHIAGTNGKGSCSHTIASILQADGWRVGLYTSPHLVDFRERIRVNGEMISEQYVVNFVEKHRNFFEPLHPSFFELTTALAFKYFAEQKVDIAVIEVGLGGRLDCTNIITPELSVITNISLDHTQFLGSTLGQIATEKAGIIKAAVPVVVGETLPETRQVFENTAHRLKAPIIFADDEPEVINVHDGPTYLTQHLGQLQGQLQGTYQTRNINTILTSAQVLSRYNIIRRPDSIRLGLRSVCESTGLMGRWQKLGNNPTIVCDTGHNLAGWQFLAPQIESQSGQTKRIIFGMVDDKDLESVMAILPRNAKYYWTQPSTHRAIPVRTIETSGRKHHLVGKQFSTVLEAYETALTDASKTDFIFIGGSSYVVADLLSAKPFKV